MEINLNTTIRQLREAGLISNATRNSLHRGRLYTLRDILNYIQGDVTRLLALRSLGQQKLEEVKNVLQTYYYPIRDTPSKVRWETTIKELYARNLISVRSFHSFEQANLLTIEDIVLYANGNPQRLLTLRNFGRKSLTEIGPLLDKFPIDKEEIDREDDAQEGSRETKIFASPMQQTLIERSFHRISQRLSERASKIWVANFPTYQEVIPFFYKPLSEYRDLCPGQYMKKTQMELFGFIQRFASDFQTILKLSPHDALSREVAETFPFLDYKQLAFAVHLCEVNQSQPLFFVLYIYLRKSDNRTDYVYSLLNGIRDDNFHSLTEAGKILHLTRERVRQLSVKKLTIPFELADHKDWANYAPLFALSYITELSPKYRMTHEEEQLPFGFDIFSRLLTLVASFRRFQAQGKSILVSERLLSSWDFEQVLEHINHIFHAQYSRDMDFRLRDLTEGVPGDLMDEALGLLSYVVSEAYSCQISEDGVFTIEQNRIDVAQEIYDILYKNGRPMHIEEIFTVFKNLYPEHRYEDSKYLRPYIHKHPHIRPIGNTSTYTLDSWNVYSGGVRDRLREVLSESHEPLPIDDIVKRVLEVVPYTNRASILSSMDSSDFVPYKPDRWGLADRQYDTIFQRNQVGRQRKAFDERFDEFKEFVETYHRFPFSTGGETEGMLSRWLNNVRRGIITTTSEQKEHLEKTLQSYRELHYCESVSEQKCLEKCNEYREYIEANYELPTRQANEELYSWMYKMKREFNGLTENSRHYLKQLFDYVQSYGFNI